MLADPGALARLELAGEMVPSLDWLLYAFVRKEAVLTSQIEGTRATLVDLLAAEAAAETDVRGGAGAYASTDLRDVSNCLDALAFAVDQLADPPGLPLSMRLLNEARRRLMRGFSGKRPGETVLARATSSLVAVRLFERLPRHPIVSIAFVTRHLRVSKPTAGRAVEALERAGVLVETTGRKRERSWAYRSYLDRLREGTELSA